MNVSIIDGKFKPSDAIDILTQIMQVKIKFHENKIHQSLHEEDIKMREKRIKQLQHDLQEIRNFINQNGEFISLKCTLELTK